MVSAHSLSKERGFCRSLGAKRPFTIIGAVAALSAMLLAMGCESEDLSTSSMSDARALEAAFEDASQSHGIPTAVLKAVGYNASRWYHPPAGASDLHGVMQLSDEAVSDAAALTGLSEQEIRSEPRANIEAAAALMSTLARNHLSSERDDVRAWWDVLLIWSDARTPQVAEMYATQVLRTIAKGATRAMPDGSILRLAPSPVTLPTGLGTLTQAQDPDYPGADWVPADESNHSDGRNDTVDRVVLTTVGGSATSAINTFQDPDTNRSVHYLVHWDGTITQLVSEDDSAWHSACYNHRSIGIMFEGWYDVADNYTEEMYEEAAELVRWITDERGLDASRDVVIGHSDVDCGDGVQRYAPGDHFEWDLFLATVNDSKIMGEVFYGEDFDTDVLRDDNRIEDALVWLDTGQMTMSEGALGRFEFLVPPETYQITAEADGYETGTRSCEVVADAVTWCSIMVEEIDDPDPDPEQGTLSGIVVWGEEDENPFDIITNHPDTRFVAGATVTIEPGPITVTTNDEGFYFAEVDPGTYTITADADGYEPREAALGAATLEAGETVYRSVMIIAPPPTQPEVTITEPSPGDVFQQPDITVAGHVEHDKPIASFTVNGSAVSLDAQNEFSTTVTIPPGPSTIMVTAEDEDGVTASASVGVVYETEDPDPSGVDGFVWDEALGMGTPIEGATIRVGSLTTTSESDGWFSMDVAPGTYALTITADGYHDHDDTVTVVSGGRTELLIALVPEGEEVGPEVTILTPQDEEVLEEADVLVEGFIVPADPDIVVTINQIEANYADGDFSGVVNLLPGPNAIFVEATDAGGLTGSAAITVYYEEQEPEPVTSGVDGFVFDAEEGPSSAIEGAFVIIGEAEVYTDQDGAFSVDVLSGSRSVFVAAQGYEDYDSTLTVPEDHRASLEIGLTPVDDDPEPDDPEDPVIEITWPADDEVIDTANVMVTGVIHDQDVASVFVNGIDADIAAAIDGFTAEISLEPGENDIEAIAEDAHGSELGRTMITVHYSGAATSGCSCSTQAGSPGQSVMAALALLSLVALSRRRQMLDQAA